MEGGALFDNERGYVRTCLSFPGDGVLQVQWHASQGPVLSGGGMGRYARDLPNL